MPSWCLSLRSWYNFFTHHHVEPRQPSQPDGPCHLPLRKKELSSCPLTPPSSTCHGQVFFEYLWMGHAAIDFSLERGYVLHSRKMKQSKDMKDWKSILSFMPLPERIDSQGLGYILSTPFSLATQFYVRKLTRLNHQAIHLKLIQCCRSVVSQ